jgi:hypothetical protein
MRALLSVIVGVVSVAFFTTLLVLQEISEIAYSALVALSALVAIIIYGFPRLAELDIKNLRLTLREVKEATFEAKNATRELEQAKKELAEMYGGIENLRREPFVLDEQKQNQLGLGQNGIVMASGTMRYPAGCIKRERERLASIFVNEKSPEEVAKAILDASLDDLVFKWDGPEVGLNAPPRTTEERRLAKEKKEASSSQ